MTPKTKLFLGIASAMIVVLTALPNLIHAEQRQNAELSKDIRTVKLRGAGTALKLATVNAGDNQVDVVAEDNIGCSFSTTMTQQDDALVIEVIKSGFRFGPWCDPDVTISMPEGLTLDIGLENLAADISGVFGDVKIRSDNSVINFDGRADHFAMKGKKAAVRLKFAAEMPREAVDIDVDTILSDIDFAGA